jgi:hypothetical protein
MVMNAIHLCDRRPYISAKFSIDDFGDEVMAVVSPSPQINRFQIVISEGTFWHLFDLEGKVIDWREGHYEE